MIDEIQKLHESRKSIGSWGHIAPQRLKAVTRHAGKRVLDAGCSTGSYVRLLRMQGYQSYGFDLLKDPNWSIRENNDFMLADVIHMPYADNAFDTIISFEVLEHIEQIDWALEEFHRVTDNNLIISVPNCIQPPEFRTAGLAFHHWIDRTHKQFFSQESLDKKLAQHRFSIDFIQLINPIRPEILFLTGWRIPRKVAHILSKGINKIPLRHKYYMTILAVASKN